MSRSIQTSKLPAVILYCPHLERDISQLLRQVPSPQIVTGLPVVPGEAGCLEMHQSVVRWAKKSGFPAIWVMEDDCLLTDAFSLPALLSAVAWAREHGYNVVQGGSVLTTDARRVAPGLVSVTCACSAHFMVYLAGAYDAVLAAEQPFDLSIADHGARSVVTLPFMAIQRRGLSGIGSPLEAGASKTYAGPAVVDYEGIFRMHEQHLLETCR